MIDAIFIAIVVLITVIGGIIGVAALIGLGTSAYKD